MTLNPTKQVCVNTRLSDHSMTPPAPASAAANQLLVVAAVYQRVTYRQTDGRTDGHPTVTQTLHAYYAGSINKSPRCRRMGLYSGTLGQTNVDSKKHSRVCGVYRRSSLSVNSLTRSQFPNYSLRCVRWQPSWPRVSTAGPA